MENNLCSIADQISADAYSLKSLIMHASIKSRSKREISEDLNEMNELVLRILKLACGK